MQHQLQHGSSNQFILFINLLKDFKFKFKKIKVQKQCAGHAQLGL